jgi:hypothetical protein
MKTPIGIASQGNYEAATGDHLGRPSTFVIPGLTRNPVPLGAGFLDFRSRGNDNPDGFVKSPSAALRFNPAPLDKNYILGIGDQTFDIQR